MSREFIAGKRYPRGLTRKRFKKDGKNLSCSYLNVGKLKLTASKDQSTGNMRNFDKMVRIS